MLHPIHAAAADTLTLIAIRKAAAESRGFADSASLYGEIASRLAEVCQGAFIDQRRAVATIATIRKAADGRRFAAAAAALSDLAGMAKDGRALTMRSGSAALARYKDLWREDAPKVVLTLAIVDLPPRPIAIDPQARKAAAKAAFTWRARAFAAGAKAAAAETFAKALRRKAAAADSPIAPFAAAGRALAALAADRRLTAAAFAAAADSERNGESCPAFRPSRQRLAKATIGALSIAA